MTYNTQVCPNKQPFVSSFFSHGKSIVKSTGVRHGLYRGMFTHIVTNTPIQAFYYGVYNVSLTQLTEHYDRRYGTDPEHPFNK